MIREYYELTKPRLMYGNILAGAAGFFVAGSGPLNWGLLAATLLGLAFVIGAACTVNNWFDRALDARMDRTKNRALARGAIGAPAALSFAAVLLALGVAVLWFFTTGLALATALFAFVIYTAVYTPLKYYSAHALWVGALAGAMPPVVGYTAAYPALDTTALLLFAFLFTWQVPHFIAIAIYRYDDYAAGSIPLFIPKPPTVAQKKVARRVFYASLVVLLLWCAGLILQRWIR